MKTQQDTLEAKGMATNVRQGEAPRVLPRGLAGKAALKPCLPPSRQRHKKPSAAQKVMLREAMERHHSREYQLALSYEDESFFDVHRFQAPNVPKEAPLAPKPPLESVRKAQEGIKKKQAREGRKATRNALKARVQKSHKPPLSRHRARVLAELIRKEQK